MSGPPPIRRCHFCGEPLPRNANPLQKYCSRACRQANYRTKRNPMIPQKAKVTPSNGTGDPELDNILFMKLEATLRNTLLKELLDKRREEGRREALETQDEWKEKRTIDAATAKEVADFLAQKYDPSRTGKR